MSKEFWPGTDIEKSMDNDFTGGGLINWAKEMVNAGNSANSTALVEKRRKNGTDNSTFRGMSRRADAAIKPYRPQTESKSARIRGFLKDGPKDSVELAQLMGIKGAHARALMQYDVEQGNVVKLRDFSPIKYALSGAA